MYNLEELQVREAFNKQATIFDTLYKENRIIQYKRSRVRHHVLKYLQPGHSILELNAGTGEDAIFFAEQGINVHAIDISKGMLEILEQKVRSKGLKHLISSELRSFTALHELEDKGPFDLILSNFAGLNCTSQLNKVLRSFQQVLKPGGTVVLVIMPRFCLWESLLVLKGNFRAAFRRFRSGHGAEAQIEGIPFRCWYYNPGYVIDTLGKGYQLLAVEGLCSILPPSYLESFPSKYPGLFKTLMRLEDKYKSRWPWKYIGDYYIISLRRDL